MPKKVNPHRKPCTEADVKRAFDNGVTNGVRTAAAIFLTVLADKFNGRDWIPDIWEEINKLSEEVAESRVSVPDLRRVLREEYDVDV